VVDLGPLKSELARAGSLTLAVKVIPKSSRCEVTAVLGDGTLKLKINAAPEKGKANAEVCELLAREFAVSRSCVAILRGETSPVKQIRIVAR
jgi:uncharacterized protein (TIGR00251 family)